MDTIVASEDLAVETSNPQPVTDTEATPAIADVDTKSDTTTPQVEYREGKLFVDGQRAFSRNDANKIIAAEKSAMVKDLLTELDVDSLDQVKDVVKQIKTLNPEENSLNVNSLKQTLAKREATVEELQAEVKNLKTDLLLKDHMTQLYANMPEGWQPQTKNAVVDLMKSRNMFQVENDTFAIRNGEEFLTTDGTTPDYAGAVKLIGETLGLNMGKQGVDLKYGDSATESRSTSTKAVDDKRLNTDAEYRRAYVQLREYKPNLKKADVTHNMVMKNLDRLRSRQS